MIPFESRLLIPFHLADPAGILFFGHVFMLAHQAYEQFICEHLSIKWEDWFSHDEWVVPIKQTEASYYCPLKAGKECKIQLSVEEVRGSSFSFLYHFSQEHSLCCAVKTVHVFCNKVNRTKCAIPQSIADKLRQASNSDFKTLDKSDRGILETQCT